MTELQQKIVDAARACLGTPFRHQGRIPSKALDCAGLAVVSLRAAGVEVRDMSAYSSTPHDDKLMAIVSLQRGLRFVGVDSMQPGDVLILKIGNEPSHIGIYTGNKQIIHAYEQAGKVVEHRMDGAWHTKIVACYRAEAK